MGASPFQSAIEAALKPLEFAARDDFAHLGRVQDLEAAVAGAATRALTLAIPRDVRRVLEKMAKALKYVAGAAGMTPDNILVHDALQAYYKFKGGS